MAEYRFIENIRDYFNPGYFTDEFGKKVAEEAGLGAKDLKAIDEQFGKLSELYRQYKNKIVNGNLVPKYKIEETHHFHTDLLKLLGYKASTPYQEWLYLDDTSVVPVRHIYREGAKCTLLIMEMQTMIPVGDAEPDGLFGQHYDEENIPDVREQRYRFSQWEKVIPTQIPEDCKISPTIINRAIDEIFTLPKENQRPNYILMLAGNKVFLLDQKEWHNGAYVIFDIEQLLIDVTDKQRNKNFFALFYLLCGKDALAGESETALMSRLHEASVKNAYSVTKDLKTGVVKAVETLANEAIHYKREVLKEEFDETKEEFAQAVKDDCLRIIYRLLFVFYAEAKPELGILPMKDEVYLRGYSLEMLRDLEQTPLHSVEAQYGYFFHDSLWRLFRMIQNGYNENGQMGYQTFRIKKIDSPLFDDEEFTVLKGVKYRNSEWQKIIRELSLSQEKSDKRRGRISYANLGINQLGSVYESLLAYRGFYASEEFIEVHKAGKPQDGTFLVPRSRFNDFKSNEILREGALDEQGKKRKKKDSEEEARIVSHPEQEFIYRLNGIDRKKSASYYTPEVLTKSTVKYTLLGYEEKLRRGEMRASDILKLKILEPAMGAAAFQNEVINQLADMYIRYYEKENNTRLNADKRPMEVQKVKAFIATRNTYGVDLNLTAIELGKLSLWLNVMHPNMETPYFGTHLAWGNAVIGAWLKVYSIQDFYKEPTQRGNRFSGYELVKWWERPTHKVGFSKGKQKKVLRKTGKDTLEIYHFLLPDEGMLGVMNESDLKKASPQEAKRMATIKSGWLKPITRDEVKRLRDISTGIDRLLESYMKYQAKVEAATASGFSFVGMPTRQRELFSYAFKQSISDTRNNSASEYYRLKMILDYWCSLWYWDLEDAAELPTRDTYWTDIEDIIGPVMNEVVSTGTKNPSSSSPSNDKNQLSLDFGDEESSSFCAREPDIDEEDEEMEENPAPVSKQEAESMIGDMKNRRTSLNNSRTEIVKDLAVRYRFFHPMLEFIEVFWLRDGFDIICGNPPWLKYEFKDEDIVQEKYPEVVIRKSLNAAAIRKKLASIFEETPSMEKAYHDELVNYVSSSAFMNAKCNYPLLEGQQTNLYKCVLENGFSLLSPTGYMGLLHPEGIYDDPNGQPLRKEVYHRLRFHFQYLNEYKLFAEIGDRKTYSTNIYGSYKDVKFDSINNLFIPATIDDCYTDRMGDVGGIKVDGKWNITGHPDRIITYTEEELAVLGRAFNEDEDNDCVKLGTIHAKKVLKILDKLSEFKKRVIDYVKDTEEALHEANDAKAGIIKRYTQYPDMGCCELIYSGPHIFVANPLYKTPQIVSEQKADYDCLDLTKTCEDYVPRTNYIPVTDIVTFKNYIKISDERFKRETEKRWIELYRVGARKMLNVEGERTLTPAILPPGTTHINGIVSTTFPKTDDIIEFAGITASLVMDFIVKTLGARNLSSSRIESFQMGIEKKYQDALYSRVLLLNCVNKYYADLWRDGWHESFKTQTWSLSDHRLKAFSTLSEEWTKDTPLRNYFERRQALIEIDVLVAMALGLSFDDLKTIYQVQFPVLQEYDDETWYDANGSIVFTTNKGLAGVGVERKGNPKKNVLGWEDVRGELSDDTLMYKGTSESFSYIMPEDKSEIYAGDEYTFVAPYTRCDRLADYKRAWDLFEKTIK